MDHVKQNPRMARYCETKVQKQNLTPIFGYQKLPLVSLIEAVRPLIKPTNGWNKYIGEAYTDCHFPSEHNLTREESAAIYLYTMQTSFYGELNKTLRQKNRKEIEPWFPFLKLFNSALDKLPDYRGVLWRGVNINLSKEFKGDKVYTWWPFTSCSEVPEVVKSFMDAMESTLFTIDSKNGKVISLYSYFPNEKEVLLRMGTTFNAVDDPTTFSELNLIHLIDINKEISPHSAHWRNQAVTIAGGHGEGRRTNQLSTPHGIFVSKDRTLYIADFENDRIVAVAWKSQEKSVTVIAGGNGKGNGLNQLNGPRDVAIDSATNNLLICDRNNRRVLAWPLEGKTGDVVVNNIACVQLAVDSNGSFYVSDEERHEVRRFDYKGDPRGELVAGGHESGESLHQLSFPTHIYVDAKSTVFISDSGNNRVVKWPKGATEGIVVAGGNGHGKQWNQLGRPGGVWADAVGNVYVVDQFNHRVMFWGKGATEGKVLVGGNGPGKNENQLSQPHDLFFDWKGNLYVADSSNHRIQQFSIS